MTMHRQLSVDPAAQSAIRPYLRTAEPLDWAEKPPGWCLALRETFRLVHALFFCAIIFTVTAVMTYGILIPALKIGSTQGEPSASILVPAFAVPFAFTLFGIVFLVLSAHRFLGGWFTYYGLTDSRVLILRSLTPAKIVSLGPEFLPNMSRTGESGRGTISFVTSQAGSRFGWPEFPNKLIGIRNPAGVEALIVSTLRPADTQGRY
ncbi:MAG: hypothetical protein AAGF14_03195 [Pseudomonadota bacterium]